MRGSRYFVVLNLIVCLGTLTIAAQQPPASSNDIASLQQRAATGDAVAENNLGFLYQHGQGVTQDYTQALIWYTKAAAQGNADAEGNLGYLYYSGQGVTQDYAQAFTWYTKAAAQGSVAAENNLGSLYYSGQGVTQDYRQALAWDTKAADQGSATAENNLGYLYNHGLGVAQDYAQARTWYQKAADQGLQIAKQELTKLNAPPVSPAAQVIAADSSVADEVEQRRQDIADKIENLQSDADEHDNAASDWDTTAQNAQDTSNCTGSGASICAAMGRMGAIKAQSNASKERAAASNDRSDIARLQGQLDSMPANNSSPAGQNASGNSGGSGSGSGYNPDRHYSGPDSGMVQSLLDSSPGWSCPSSITQSIKWTPPIHQVCMRDYYVTAAVAAAYGAECEARLGRDQEAEQDAESMASSVKSAKSMCSNAPVVANNGPGCSTLEIVPCP